MSELTRLFSAFFRSANAALFCVARLRTMLSCRDSNPERQNQNLLCYHYTTAQSDARKRCKDIISFSKSQILPKLFRKNHLIPPLNQAKYPQIVDNKVLFQYCFPEMFYRTLHPQTRSFIPIFI